MTAAIAVAALAAGLLAGCADDSAAVRTDPTPAAPQSRLTVTVDPDGKATATKTWTLQCEPPGGDHPDPAGACAQLAAAERPFAPLPKDVMCTEIYGGPATATISGVWRGAAVAASYARQNGCGISRWDAIAKVLAGAAG
ncbi:MAG TPA: SSI family serine proteinase inhibitor [Mycobacteriales bacterium]|jgi:hypothetical protein|nr:SSI family serine proteinase inhibitor [Mycobacteriales bacterium]